MSRRIILSGVHGVGKGYFIKNKLNHVRNLSVVSASEIIAQYHDVEDAGNKRVNDVEGNQKLLLGALEKYFEMHEETVLLDGHLAILDANDKINWVPASFFDKGMLDTIILLQDEAQLIYDRLYNRDGVHKLEVNIIEQIQKAEQEYAMKLECQGIEVRYITPSSEASSYIDLF